MSDRKQRFHFRKRPAAQVRRAPATAEAVAAPVARVAGPQELTMEPVGPRLTPRDEAVFLLHTAAEIEHCLLVQYLYAAYTATNSEWRRKIITIAVQEMAHLVSMQSLLHFVGGPLNFDRQDFPFRSEFYPFQFKLEPLSLDSLAKYIVAEMPEIEPDAELQAIIDRAQAANQSMELNRVGALFEYVDEVMSRLQPEDVHPATADTYQADPPSWGAPNFTLSEYFTCERPESDPAPVGTDLGGPRIVATVRTVCEARSLLKAIAVQGEGATDTPTSHYRIFLDIYREVLDSGQPVGVPAPTNPNSDRVPHSDMNMEAGRITDAESRRWAELCDLRYRMLLTYMTHALHLDRTTQSQQRKALVEWTFWSMRGQGFLQGLKGISEHLLTLPQHDPPQTIGGVVRKAGPPFSLPYTLRIPALERDRWRLHLDLIDASEILLKEVTSNDDLRDAIRKTDDEVRRKIAEFAGTGTPAPPSPGPDSPPDPMPPAPSDGSSISGEFRELLKTKQPIAAFVHGSIAVQGESLSKLFEEDRYDDIVKFLSEDKSVRPPTVGMPLLTPGDPSKSAFYLQLTDPAGVMNGRFDAEEIKVVERWIRNMNARVAPVAVSAEKIADGFSQPLFLTHAPGDDDHVFVVEKTGAIRILTLDDNSIANDAFLTVDDLSTNGERGLLGLAFHPDYAANGRFFVNCTDVAGRTNVREYARDAADRNRADPASRRDIMRVDQPFSNHNGGWIGFGPTDGFLYVALGDGGSANDPARNGQNRNTLLGKLLRIDIDSDDFPGDALRNYGIPASNPFVGDPGARDEIWALGLRNPWRCSFDRDAGDLWIADVGQSAREEINFQAAISRGGQNYGWREREGTQPTGLDPASGQSFTEPIFEYGRNDGGSVIGGYVYRGKAIDGLAGTYFYADFVAHRVWSFRYDGTSVQQHMERTAQLNTDDGPITAITSFGEDAAGELYLVSIAGTVYRISSV